MCVRGEGSSSSLIPSLQEAGGFLYELSGPAEGRAGLWPRVRGSSWAIVTSSRHPVSRLPSVRPAGFPHAGLRVPRGCEPGPRRDRETIALPVPGSGLVAQGSLTRFFSPHPSPREGAFPTPPPSRSLLILYVRLLWDRLPPWGSFALTLASAIMPGGWGSRESRGAGKVANLMCRGGRARLGRCGTPHHLRLTFCLALLSARF